MSSSVSFINIAGFFSLFSIMQIAQCGPTAGKFQAISLSDRSKLEQLENKVRFAVDEYDGSQNANNKNDGFTTKHRLIRIVDAIQQTVAGINYKLVAYFSLSTDCKTIGSTGPNGRFARSPLCGIADTYEKCYFDMWSQSWTSMAKVTNFSCVDVSQSEARGSAGIGGPTAGKFQAISLSDRSKLEQLENKVRFAVDEYDGSQNANNNGDGFTTKHRLIKIVDARQQTVAGINYKLVAYFSLSTDCKTIGATGPNGRFARSPLCGIADTYEKCYFDMWSQSWTSMAKMNNFSCVDVSQSEARGSAGIGSSGPQ